MEKSSLQKTKVLVAFMAAATAFLADIYVIINMPRNYPVLGIVSLVFLAAFYLGISGRIKWKELERTSWEEQYQDMIRAEKACYFLIRKNFREMNGRVNTLDIKIDPLAKAGEINHKKISGLLDTLMQEQKKIAKITVSRNKENANAMMNSNDKVIEKMFEMQDGMSRISEAFENQPEDPSQEEISLIKENQQKLAEKIQGIEENLNHKMDLVMEKLEEISIAAAKKEVITQVVPPVQEVQEVIPEHVLPESQTEEEALSEKLMKSLSEESLPEELAPEEGLESLSDELLPEEGLESLSDELLPEEGLESLLDGLLPEESPEPLSDELLPEESEKSPSDDLAAPAGGTMTPEEIAALIAEDSNQTAPEPIEPWTPPAEEDGIAPRDDIAPADEITPMDNVVPEPAPKAPEPVSKAPEPEVANPNKMMTPEEIAALIAGTAAEAPAAEKAPEPEPKAPEPAPKAPEPESSNPNKMMSPEDIAALIANM